MSRLEQLPPEFIGMIADYLQPFDKIQLKMASPIMNQKVPPVIFESESACRAFQTYYETRCPPERRTARACRECSEVLSICEYADEEGETNYWLEATCIRCRISSGHYDSGYKSTVGGVKMWGCAGCEKAKVANKIRPHKRLYKRVGVTTASKRAGTLLPPILNKWAQRPPTTLTPEKEDEALTKHIVRYSLSAKAISETGLLKTRRTDIPGVAYRIKKLKGAGADIRPRIKAAAWRAMKLSKPRTLKQMEMDRIMRAIMLGHPADFDEL
ncbi:MAG: hypothetical protein Q9181_002542 [Wetmoreana brouardii]